MPDGLSSGGDDEVTQRMIRAMRIERDYAESQLETLAERVRGLEGDLTQADRQLREHISLQISQISIALEAAEKLELGRLARVDSDLRAVARETALLRESAQHAQTKFEESVSARFIQVNEFRGSLDDLGKQMATRRELEATQAISNSRYTEIQKQLQELRSRVDVGPPQLEQLEAYHYQQQGRQAGIGLSANAIAVVLTIAIALIAMIATAYIATH